MMLPLQRRRRGRSERRCSTDRGVTRWNTSHIVQSHYFWELSTAKTLEQSAEVLFDSLDLCPGHVVITLGRLTDPPGIYMIPTQPFVFQ